MKIVAWVISHLLWMIITLVTMAVLGLFAFFYVYYYGSGMYYTRHKTISVYKKYEDEFEIIQKGINQIDLTDYYDESGYTPNVLVRKNKTEEEYRPYISYVYTKTLNEIKIEDDAMQHALDVLFQEAGIDHIVQTKDETTRNLYFCIKAKSGVVYSCYGGEPQDKPADQHYYYKRINDNWFYWTCSWDD